MARVESYTARRSPKDSLSRRPHIIGFLRARGLPGLLLLHIRTNFNLLHPAWKNLEHAAEIHASSHELQATTSRNFCTSRHPDKLCFARGTLQSETISSAVASTPCFCNGQISLERALRPGAVWPRAVRLLPELHKQTNRAGFPIFFSHAASLKSMESCCRPVGDKAQRSPIRAFVCTVGSGFWKTGGAEMERERGLRVIAMAIALAQDLSIIQVVGLKEPWCTTN